MRPRTPARFEFDVQRTDERLISVTIRPVAIAGVQVTNDETLSRISVQLRRRVLREMRSFIPTWSDRRIRDTIQGILQASNLENASKFGITDEIYLREIDHEALSELIERIHQSNEEVTIYSVSWTFLLTETTTTFGGSGGKTVKYMKPDAMRGVMFWEVQDEALGCGIVSFYIGYKAKTGKTELLSASLKRAKKFMKTKFARDVLELQEKVYDGKTEICMEDLRKLLWREEFQDFRIAIIWDKFSKCLSYEGQKYAYEENMKKDKTVFIFYDMKAKHFVPVIFPKEWLKSMRNTTWRWCFKCLKMYSLNITSSRCDCKEDWKSGKALKRKQKECDHCGERHTTGTHRCGELQCIFCQQFYRIGGGEDHRCPLYINSRTLMKGFVGDEKFENIKSKAITEDSALAQKTKSKPYSLYAWDIESHILPLEDKETLSFEFDDDGYFKFDDEGDIIYYNVKKQEQIPNFIAWQNVFTGEKYETSDLFDFIKFCRSENDGYNIMIAHNSSGYDTRLIFDSLLKYLGDNIQIKPIMRGGKFMRLEIDKKTIFQDSLLHLTRSLSVLAKGFKLKTEKGIFPHLFNQPVNRYYEGRIPDLKYYDVGFMMNDDEEYKSFMDWHKSFTGIWNFDNELKKYCRNDVEILAKIMRLYHDEWTGLIAEKYAHVAISPWFFPTMAGHVHKMCLGNLHHGKNLEKMTPEELKKYVQKTWAVLTPQEHYFAKKAMRGGRTDIRKYFHEGVIEYKDIQSSYPNEQLSKQFPVGTPDIIIFDKEYYPCNHHYEDPEKICECSLEVKKKYRARRMNVTISTPVDSPNSYLENIACDEMYIAMVDVTPPKTLFHPILVIFDKISFKCIAPLTPITKGFFCSAELDVAIKHGYKVTKIYRIDIYKKADSLWRGLLGDMYLNKLKNGGKAPADENDRARMRNTFRTKFGIDLGSMNDWGDNPIKKQAAKGPITAAWGKHAETVDHEQAVIFNHDDTDQAFRFYNDMKHNETKITQFTHMNDRYTIFKYMNSRRKIKPNLHKGYLPVAVFVTAYARLHLWKELHKLGKRVLMHDTDSIIYASSPGEYTIPEGDCLGDWETETKYPNINKFVAIGPKSYAFQYGDGKQMIKCKGINIKRAHARILNIEAYEKILKDGEIVQVPQMSFDWSINHGMSTRKFLKQLKFRTSEVKGKYNAEEYRSYPIGYET